MTPENLTYTRMKLVRDVRCSGGAVLNAGVEVLGVENKDGTYNLFGFHVNDAGKICLTGNGFLRVHVHHFECMGWTESRDIESNALGIERN